MIKGDLLVFHSSNDETEKKKKLYSNENGVKKT